MAKNIALTENDVVEAVAAYLKTQGYNIEQALTTEKRGIDIVARHCVTDEWLFVEAKGGTSSKEKTSRFGKPFTSNQAKTHVSVALYFAAKLYHYHSSENVKVALALPGDLVHRGLIDDIRSVLDALSISVFFVGDDDKWVTEEPARR